MLSKLSIDNRIKNSVSIIEGQVTNQTSCWNSDKSSIFTINTIQVSSILKGSASTTIEIITPGGELDGRLLVVEPNASLKTGTKGIFFLTPNTNSLNYNSSRLKFEIYALAQGFIELDEVSGNYNDAFDSYKNRKEIYAVIQKTTGINYREAPEITNNSESGDASITHFSPATITAGTQSVLTIDGWGFGERKGSATVQFRDANSTSSAVYTNIPDSSYIISWTNTEIKVIVPGASISRQGGAGTGAFNVITSTGVAISSVAPLYITYNQFEYKKNKTSLINQNGSGGYTFTLNTDLNNNTAAKDAFLRGLNKWKCNTNINFSLSSSTSSSTCSNQMDNINLVSFATSSCPMPVGALAVTYSSYTLCAGSPIIPDGIDMIFSPSVNFYIGTDATPSNQYDFESVVLHELGHAFGQGHHSDYTEIMFPSIANGVMKRTLNPLTDLASVNEIVSRSIGSSFCGYQKHSKITNPVCNTPQVTPIISQFVADKTVGCAPLTVKFTDQSSGSPTSWKWDISNNGSVDYTSQHPTHTFTTEGTYTVKLTAINSNAQDSIVKTAIITVAPALKANIDLVQTINCNGANNAILKVTPIGGNGTYSYLWNNNQTSQTLSNLPIGNYTVTVRDGYNCMASANKSITQPEKININVVTELKNNNKFNATLNVTGGVAPYIYTLNNNTQYSSNVIPDLNTGNYSLQIKDNNNCIETTSFSVEAPTGIIEAEYSFDKLDIFPNPASNSVNINFTLKEYKSVKLELFDLSGQTIYQNEFDNIKDQQSNLDLSNLSAGTYVLKFGLPEGNTFRKIIINR